ncbi:hypothetical protein LEP1GSC125_2721 [Leptospira mayottensis 200901122]|uniref:Uncharacterized protein n=1 Tax=Leptospira mayottensis 200901122 TaxID=1193010 RepID=A0AA87SX25_9LEPT|nr:hypothetical protein LEP1GSC125_2721 [Leptospira mayottensis 200901122]
MLPIVFFFLFWDVLSRVHKAVQNLDFKRDMASFRFEY